MEQTDFKLEETKLEVYLSLVEEYISGIDVIRISKETNTSKTTVYNYLSGRAENINIHLAKAILDSCLSILKEKKVLITNVIEKLDENKTPNK